MNINQAASSSMREASTELYLSQPALSSSARELEEELGILMFERSNKGVFLTDEGREFLSYAKKAVGQYAILEERYLSRDSGRERFSVSTQHYNFAIKAFAQVIRQTNPEGVVWLCVLLLKAAFHMMQVHQGCGMCALDALMRETV